MKEQRSNILPTPSANFTLPSLYDSLELDCRLYFPHNKSEVGAVLAKGFAIFAHPYAPLGGCYDDPVVNTVGSVLLRQGYLLTTFNFRGADKSPGRTSWSGRGELGDYVSLYAFCLSMMNMPGVLSHFAQDSSTGLEPGPVLLLGGYSYGSMIAAHLPGIDVVSDCLLNAPYGTPEKEVEVRAQELANAFLGYCEARTIRGRNMDGRKASDTASVKAATTYGGYESPDAAHRISRDRSLRRIEVDRVRHSVERVRRKLSFHRSDSSTGHQAEAESVPGTVVPIVVPKLRYLLISPLLGSIATLATMFSTLKFERRGNTAIRVLPSTTPEETLSKNPSLVVYGTEDHFTSSSRIKAWCTAAKARPDSLLISQEIQGAGHFWHDAAIEGELVRSVDNWLVSFAG